MTTNIYQRHGFPQELPKAYDPVDVEEKYLDVKSSIISFVPKREHMYPKGNN